MAVDRTLAYAEALFGVARAEGTLSEVEDELFRFSQTLQGNDELREALTDPGIPAARRQQVVEDLLGGRASPRCVRRSRSPMTSASGWPRPSATPPASRSRSRSWSTRRCSAASSPRSATP